jgi:hypothetical protein
MQNNTLELITGAYTGSLWESLEGIFADENSPEHIHDVLKSLHDCGKSKESFALVRVLYDIAGLSMPNAVESLDSNDEFRSVYISELLTDIENII